MFGRKDPAGDETFLRLDATNGPLTGQLEIADAGLVSGNAPFLMTSGTLDPLLNAFDFDTSVNHTTGKLLNLSNAGVPLLAISGLGNAEFRTPPVVNAGTVVDVRADFTGQLFYSGLGINVQQISGAFATAFNCFRGRYSGSTSVGLDLGGTGTAGITVNHNSSTGRAIEATVGSNGGLSAGVRVITGGATYGGSMIDLVDNGGAPGFNPIHYSRLGRSSFLVDSAGNVLANGYLSPYFNVGPFLNNLTYTNQLDNAIWIKNAGITVFPDTVIAPDGTLTADSVDPSGNFQEIAQTSGLTGSAGDTVNVSWWQLGSIQASLSVGGEGGVTSNFSGSLTEWTFKKTAVTLVAPTAAPAKILFQNTSDGGVPFSVWGVTLTKNVGFAGHTPVSSTIFSDPDFTGLMANRNLLVTSDLASRARIIAGSSQAGTNLLEIQDVIHANQIFITDTFDLNFVDTRNVEFGTVTGTKIGTAPAQKIGFWNAAPIVQPAVTGSRAGNAALASLLSQLAAAGLIVDNTIA